MPILIKRNNSIIMEYEDGTQYDVTEGVLLKLSLNNSYHSARNDYKELIKENKIFYQYGKLASGIIYVSIYEGRLYLKRYKHKEIAIESNTIFQKHIEEILPKLEEGEIVDDYFVDDVIKVYEERLENTTQEFE